MILKSYREIIYEQNSTLNEQDVVNLFHSYLSSGMNIGSALEKILSDPLIIRQMRKGTENETDQLSSAKSPRPIFCPTPNGFQTEQDLGYD